MTFLAIILALLLAAVHLSAVHLHGLQGARQRLLLSAAGGVAVAYVFVHILPSLAAHQAALAPAANRTVGFLEHHVYLLSLAGLAAFYGLERAAIISRRQRPQHEPDRPSPGLFWVHVVSFGLYNALIGYLLVQRDRESRSSLLLFSAAMGTHFIVNDVGLRRHHADRYDRIGRWILAAAVVFGAGVGLLVSLSDAWLAVLFSLLAGGIVLNVLKEELPEERRSSFWAFAVGIVAYTALLLLL